jgi:basic membrane protein A
VAAFPFPNVNLPLNGYIEGAKSVNGDVVAKATYIESWFDPPKAKESATAQISAGADFIYAERFGPFEAVTEKAGTYAFGHFVDQSSLAPQVVVTSAIAKWDPSILQAIDGWWAHEAEGAAYSAPTDRIVFLMKDGGSDLAPFHDLDSVIPQEVKDAVEKAKADIMSGALTVTMNEAPVQPG